MSTKYKLSILSGKIIAIDGPAGSGKSTTARILASRIGYIYLDTGAMYRAITWFALQNGISVEDGESLGKIARKANIVFKTDEDINRVFWDGEDITEGIRSHEVTAAVSPVSAHSGVRSALKKQQEKIATNGGVVAEGRDTTSVVFPDADIKVYLDASLEERARRRLLEFTRKGISTSLKKQVEEISRRDAMDSNRKIAPLKRTDDSIILDTTDLTIEEQVERIIKLIKTRISGA